MAHNITATHDPLRHLTRRLLGQLAQASRDHALIEPGDHILVGVSGGKDSYTLLDLLRQLQQRAPFEFTFVAVNIDQGHPGFPRHVLEEYMAREGHPAEFVIEDTYSVVKEKVPEGKTYCSLCSRLRRGILYTTARRLGANKIALGHHRDDLTVTLLLNLLYSGQIKAMPPRLLSDDGDNIVIRPLCYSSEEDIAEYARLREFPILPCDLCGSQDNLKRQRVKQLIAELHAENPNVRGNLFAALSNVRTSHLMPPGAAPTQLGERRLRVVSEVPQS
jgi:tRNA 2-thiocytidine biosynthesis protein TtcA